MDVRLNRRRFQGGARGCRASSEIAAMTGESAQKLSDNLMSEMTLIQSGALPPLYGWLRNVNIYYDEQISGEISFHVHGVREIS